MEIIGMIQDLLSRGTALVSTQLISIAAQPAPVAPATIPANFHGAAEKLTQEDIAAVAQHIGVDLPTFRAVILTETRGSGFDRTGRPKMLFEPHVFYRLLARQRPGDLDDAVTDGLAYQRWGSKPYPPDSYPRVTDAIAIDRELALQSASWGVGQVLGENHKQVGYDTATAMVIDACASECKQLAMMAAFISTNGLADALQRRDWATFAAGYNGKGQVDKYAADLEDNYQA